MGGPAARAGRGRRLGGQRRRAAALPDAAGRWAPWRRRRWPRRWRAGSSGARRRPSPWRSSPGWPSPRRRRPSGGRRGRPHRCVPSPRRGGTVTLVLELDGDPHVLTRLRRAADRRGRDRRPRLTDGPVTHRLDAAVLLFAPADGWRDLLPGQPVRVAGRGRPRRGRATTWSPWSPHAGPPTPARRARRAAAGRGRAARRARRRRPGGSLDPRPAGLLPGLVVGDTRRMDPVLDEDFRAGRALPPHRGVRRERRDRPHGGPVAAAAAGGRPPRAGGRRGVSLLLGFVVLAGPSPSVVRAAAMGAVTLLALASGRPRAALPALGAAVCVLLLLDPGLARDAGFALSVLATAAIVLLAPGLVTAPAGPGMLAGPGRRPRGQRRRRPGDGAPRRRPLRNGQPGLPAGQPACRARGRPGDGARAGGDGRRRGVSRRSATSSSGAPAGRRAGWWWSPSAPRRHRTRPPAGRPAPAGRPC